MARWTARLDWRARLVWLPAQSPGLIDLVGLSPVDVDAAAWAITPDGRRLRGAGALLTAADQLLPGGVPLLATLYRVPGLRQLSDAAYRWVARHRHRLPGVPAVGLDRRPLLLTDEVRTELGRRLGRPSARR